VLATTKKRRKTNAISPLNCTTKIVALQKDIQNKLNSNNNNQIKGEAIIINRT